MSLFHCGMFKVNVVNNMCIVWSIFFSHSLERVGCFPLLFPYIYSNWFSSLFFVVWCDSSIPIASALEVTICWNRQFDIQNDEICTLLLKGLPTHSNDPMATLIPEKSLGCWIPSMILVRSGLGCQMFSLKFIQHVDHFRPCKHPMP